MRIGFNIRDVQEGQSTTTCSLTRETEINELFIFILLALKIAGDLEKGVAILKLVLSHYVMAAEINEKCCVEIILCV